MEETRNHHQTPSAKTNHFPDLMMLNPWAWSDVDATPQPIATFIPINLATQLSTLSASTVTSQQIVDSSSSKDVDSALPGRLMT